MASYEVPCVVTVSTFIDAKSGERLAAIELRREARVSQLQTFSGPSAQALAEARARSIARKLSALLDAAEELLD